MIDPNSGAARPAASLQVVTPNGGETWLVGTQRAITWNAQGVSGDVVLELLRDASLVGTIATVAASQGSYTWTVGQYQAGSAPPGTGYQIRIRTQPGDFLAICAGTICP
jgi:hypothetical protein